MEKLKAFDINFGPQHPAAHGVLRLVLRLKGERIVGLDPHIGLLHRATEKLIETKSFEQALPYFDRLDYVSMMTQEHCYALGIEQLAKGKVPLRGQYLRVIFSEITRLLNHLLAITTHALDVGALTPFLWAFEEREKLMKFYEQVSGARMHAAYIRPGGVSYDIPHKFLEEAYIFCEKFFARIDEIESLLTNNRIWKQRLIGVGIVSKADALDWSFSGVMLRGSGVRWDLRLQRPYEVYEKLDFEIPIGLLGDCYSRYIVRIGEMRQSLNIITQCINRLPSGFVRFPLGSYGKSEVPTRVDTRISMESLIDHFKTQSNDPLIIKGSFYSSIEAPKGEFGVYLITNGDTSPYRCKVRSPGFAHLQGIASMARNHLLADLVAIIGTQDIVFGEIDR